ncbi:zinc-dependent metalloprotease [Mastigocoleus sp. MO_188.B34]|uniref:zinc-dependent metalloprotease n=1 Tax=Mastigocoleus sp. MO_188.B34 TaxID=3036635 RepID=UPI00261686A6|nr:zinc-dependent metalloprotease [Mastigocoleus sp. MO_188.B34]MDJ0696425.1 zinc-dependent metalloprotease [Mastigocoleus sp. MO_188.B34]
MKRLIFNIICLQSLCLGVVAACFNFPVNKALASAKLRESGTAEKQKSSLVEEVTTNQVTNEKESGLTFSATSTSVKKDPIPQQEKLNTSQVWVIDGEDKAQKQPFIWEVKDINKIDRQPFLQVNNQLQKVTATTGKSTAVKKKTKKTTLKPFSQITKNTELVKGLFNIYKDKEKNKIYLEIHPSQLNKNFLATATLESGIGEAGIYSGMPLQDFLFYFQRINKKLNFIVRNVNFRAQEGDPQRRSLARSFSDSVLYTVKIKSIHPQRKTILIDLGDLLLSDLAGLSSSLGVSSSKDKSYFGNAKAFPKNVEIESVLNFSKASRSTKKDKKFGSLPDSRGFTLRVHYSLSHLPDNNYQPRLADERVGYFITAYQDLSNFETGDPFVRYINRWNLEKQDPSAAISPPKKPIVFWIDNAVPFEYRDAIKEGVLMWNKAFENAGFKDAIQVRQMPDDATWDPSDIRYNTIRWINTVDGYFAMGPSRVNPLTGEILDADILVDASFVRALKHEYRQIVKPTKAPPRTSLSAFMQNRMLCIGNSLLGENENEQNEKSPPHIQGLVGNLSELAQRYDLCYGVEAANQYAFGSLAMQLLYQEPPNSANLKRYVHQYLRLIIAHEVGHTLGLRHNFRGSTLLEPDEMNDKGVTRRRGISTSVMDYLPPNIAPPGTKQGDYFPNGVGVYDEWAIKYGYMPTKATSPIAEKPFLEKIARDSEKPELSYATDEDVRNLDPTADAWDNSGDVLVYSQWQLENSRLMWDLLNKDSASKNESFSEVKEDFGKVLSHYFQQVYYISKYIGGQSFHRVSPNNSRGKLPFEPVPVEKQRKALKTLQKYVFADEAFRFSPELLNKLAPSRWRHWGSYPRTGRLDYPIHDLVLYLQTMLLRDLLSSDRISRLKDIELKTQAGQALTIPELFDTLQTGIWTEVLKPEEKDKDKDKDTDRNSDRGKGIKISSLRRGLQGQYVNLLSEMVLRKRYVPEDARKVAWYKLRQLREELKDADSKDEYTKIHLLETRDRIKKVLDAPLETN